MIQYITTTLGVKACVVVLILLSIGVSAPTKPMKETNPYTSNVKIAAQSAPRDFVPDGNMDKPAWKRAERVRFDHAWSGPQHYPEAETQVATLWTPKYLYVAFWCKYSALNTYQNEDPGPERWELWNRDVVEVFANPQPERVNHYYEFEVAPNNQWIDLEIDKDKTPFNDAGWNSGFEHATKVDSQSHMWYCEMCIPVASMTAPAHQLRPGTEWRINFYRADGPGDDTRRRFLAWSTAGADNIPSFHTPTRFGVIRFVK